MNEKILVSDMHIGVGLAQTGTLQSLSAGANPVSPRLFSFSGHAGLAKHSTLYSDPNEDEARVAAHVKELFGTRIPLQLAVRNLFGRRARRSITFKAVNRLIFKLYRPRPRWAGMNWTPAKTRSLLKQAGEKTIREVFGGYHTYLVSFPPSMARLFLDLAEKYDKRLILNLGHRFNIGICTKRENENMLSLLKYLHRHPRHILASASEYDARYVRHYLGFEPQRLPLACFHVPSRITRPKNNVVLVGPAHASRTHAADLIDTLNAKAKKHRGQTIQFAHVREVYPFYNYEDLANHPAVVVLPYSAYSVSMLELYELNIPFFVPAPALLLKYGLMRDRVLFPIYCTKRQYRRMTKGQDSSADEPSPNSYETDAQKYWLQFCFFYRTKNAIIWDSEEDLLDKLADTDLEQVRRKMYEENQRTRDAALKQWQSLVFPQESR